MPLGFDERFRRLWEYYLAYCEAGFLSGNIDVRQVVFAKVRHSQRRTCPHAVAGSCGRPALVGSGARPLGSHAQFTARANFAP